MRRLNRRFPGVRAPSARWMIAAFALVSSTASAGHGPPRDRGGSANETGRRPRLASLSPDWSMAARAPALERMRRFSGLNGEMEPRDDLKFVAAAFPDVDRRLKGDPILPLRPSLSRLFGP